MNKKSNKELMKIIFKLQGYRFIKEINKRFKFKKVK